MKKHSREWQKPIYKKLVLLFKSVIIFVKFMVFKTQFFGELIEFDGGNKGIVMDLGKIMFLYSYSMLSYLLLNLKSQNELAVFLKRQYQIVCSAEL